MADILYADDDELFRQMVGSVLDREHTVRVVPDGSRALAEVRRSPPDLILLDYRMGEPDGLTVCRELKRDPRYGHIPILILTGEREMDHRLEGFDAGADDYVSKPVDPRELSARVRALLELARRGMDRNPSSGLPGGRAIAREFDRRIDALRPFAICYLDLDNFKPFGERFGFAVSDAVIATLGTLLLQIAQESDAVAAHVGGDDFILFCDSGDARLQVERLQQTFRARLATFLPPDVAAAGSYEGKDRSGLTRRFPLTAISAAILHVSAGHSGTLQGLGEAAAEAKESAKRAGSGGIVEVRLADQGTDG